MQNTIIVTGANGQLGNEIKELTVSFPQNDFVFLTRSEFPLDVPEIAKEVFQKYQPGHLINCAAYTAVDKAETEKELAYAINAVAPALLATLCKEFDCKFVHISTDYVFDGQGKMPYKETDATNPQSVYGSTKLEGEQQIIKENNEAVIIRTSWVYSFHGKNFVKTMLKLMQEKQELNVVSDQIGSPTYAADLAIAILQIVSDKNWQGGIYHFSNLGDISWFQFASTIKELSGSQCRVLPISTEQFPTAAKRPAFSTMDCSKIKNVYGIQQKDWKQSLQICLNKLKVK